MLGDNNFRCFSGFQKSYYIEYFIENGAHTGAKILNSSKNSHFESLIFDKIHYLKASFLIKFTFSKSHFSQNSQFQSLIFHKIHIFSISKSMEFLDKKSVFFFFYPSVIQCIMSFIYTRFYPQAGQIEAVLKD